MRSSWQTAVVHQKALAGTCFLELFSPKNLEAGVLCCKVAGEKGISSLMQIPLIKWPQKKANWISDKGGLHFNKDFRRSAHQDASNASPPGVWWNTSLNAFEFQTHATEQLTEDGHYSNTGHGLNVALLLTCRGSESVWLMEKMQYRSGVQFPQLPLRTSSKVQMAVDQVWCIGAASLAHQNEVNGLRLKGKVILYDLRLDRLHKYCHVTRKGWSKVSNSL